MKEYAGAGTLAGLCGIIRSALAGKQDTLTGTKGQMVGFDAAGKAVAQDAPSGGGEVYSFEEKVIGTWIDGKPLYRIVIEQSNIGADFATINGAQGLNIDNIVKMEGLFYDIVSLSTASADYAEPINHFYTASSFGSVYMSKDKTIRAKNVGRQSSKIRLVIEYTKTTD